MAQPPKRTRKAPIQQGNKNLDTPGTIYLQVIGTGAPGAPASVYIFSDQTRYLINCGEGTQRLAHEYRTKLTRLNHIFMTRTSWKHIGGLPGLSLTIQDAGATMLTLHGPPRLQETFSAMRRFVILNKLQLNYCEQGEVFEDPVLTMTSVPLQRKRKGSADPTDPIIRIIEDDNIDYYAHERGSANASTQGRSIIQRLLEKSDEAVVLAYICKFKGKLGALNPKRCKELGVTPGPLLGQLKKGNDVVLPNGQTVLAADVRSPDEPSPVILFIDVPAREFLKSLLESTAFEEYQQDNPENCLQMIIHFTPNDISTSNEYKQFINRFPVKTKHWFINDSNKSSGYAAAHRMQCQLNLLNENVFPILGEPVESSSTSDADIATKKLKLDESLKEMNVDAIRPLTTYNLRPPTGLDRSEESIVQPDVYLSELNELKEFSESLQELKEAQGKLRPSNCIRDKEYPKIVFLGTGSCIPNKTRNVSAILVHITNTRSILLDCGEGTVGQIHRFYGPRSDEIFRRIKCIAITHLHADHHLGLIGILQTRRQILGDETDPIFLLAPSAIRWWLDSYDCRVESISGEYKLFSNSSLITETLISNDLLELGVKSFRTCLVQHCADAFAFSFIVQSSKNDDKDIKITYSGDTKPCQSLIDLGYDSTILIHEATLEDGLADEALKKAHSTVSQALEQGHKMNAKFVLLTHFSQRYAKIPRIEHHLENAGVAMDNMEVVPSDLEELAMMYPTMKKMFPTAWNEMEQRTLLREKRKENAP